MVPHVRRRQDGQDAKDIEDAVLDGMVVERRIVAAVAKIQVLGDAVADIG